jgi:hypothetical protein
MVGLLQIKRNGKGLEGLHALVLLLLKNSRPEFPYLQVGNEFRTKSAAE